MISYAQNQEDVVLSRLLNIVQNGRFVDVGAGHPVHENVTYWLYLQGWRGVNVEPMGREAQMLREVRPDDVTLQVAVGAAEGTMTLYEAPRENRGATTSDLSLVRGYRDAGQDFNAFETEVVTLDSVLGTFEPESVHILKIDVEGGEVAAIAGAALERHRPWVVVVEATRPNSSVDVSASWAPLVEAAGFVCVLFDGLNRFYVREDLSDIARLLSVPANVFDGWKPARLVDLEKEIADLVHHAADHAAAMDERFREVEAYARELEASRAATEEYARSLVDRADEAERYAVALHHRADELEAYARSLEEARHGEGGGVPPGVS